MSARWFRIRTDMMRSLVVCKMNDKQFRKSFNDTLCGEETALSVYVRGPYDRPLAHEWAVIRGEIFARDDYTCTYCQARGVPLECDHIVPVARGGSSDPSNLTTACRACNRAKRDKLIEEWRR